MMSLESGRQFQRYQQKEKTQRGINQLREIERDGGGGGGGGGGGELVR